MIASLVQLVEPTACIRGDAGSNPAAGPVGLREMELSEEAAKQLMDVLSKPSTLTIKPANMPCYQPDQNPATTAHTAKTADTK